MINIRYNNLLKYFKWFINLAIYLQIGTVFCIVISFIFMLSGEGELISSYDVEVAIQPIDFEIETKNNSLNNPQLVLNRGSIEFSSRSIGYYILKIIDTVFILTICLLITILLKRIIWSIASQEPFTLENTKRIRNIAFLLISITAYTIIQSIIYRIYIINNISIKDMQYAELSSFNSPPLANKIWIGLDIDFQPLIIGVVLIILAEVFRAGMMIRLDNESIL